MTEDEPLKIIEVYVTPDGGILSSFTLPVQHVEPAKLAWGEVLARVLHQAIELEAEKSSQLESLPPEFFRPAITKALVTSFHAELESRVTTTGEEA